MLPDDPRHGTNAGYLAHRRSDKSACQPCRRAHVHYEKRRIYDHHTDNVRMIDATGTKRRLEALVALGWTYGAIAERAGITTSGVHKAINRYTTIRREVAEKYAAVYEEMSMTLPPTITRTQKRDASYARTVARKRGFLPPLVWDDIDDPDERPIVTEMEMDEDIDEAVVVRFLAGEHTLARTATPPEKAEIVARWAAAGRSLRALREVTGWKPERYWKATA